MSATVYALSSGAPPAAIAVVRVSGPRAGDAARAIGGPLPRPRQATLRSFADADGPIDRGLLLWFPAGASVTGEDLAEFHIHGGRAVVARLLDALGRVSGLEPAGPGAFSRQAAMNGRLGLNEAEALADLLAAETEAERRAAHAVFDGALGSRIAGWTRTLIALSAEVEALIDHDEDGALHDGGLETSARAAIHAFRDQIRTAVSGPVREELRDGLKVVLSGPPNSGKSSLLNALAGRDVAIVAPVAGTTRDVLEILLDLDGRRVRIVDTAGLRETDDAVERIGVGRARDAAATADLRIWLGDEPPHDELVPTIAIHARCDLPERHDAHGKLAVSANTGAGLAALSSRIAAHDSWSGGGLVLNRRQRGLVDGILIDLDAAAAAVDLLIVAEHLRLARSGVDGLHGGAGLGALYDSVFARFCIGK